MKRFQKLQLLFELTSLVLVVGASECLYLDDPIVLTTQMYINEMYPEGNFEVVRILTAPYKIPLHGIVWFNVEAIHRYEGHLIRKRCHVEIFRREHIFYPKLILNRPLSCKNMTHHNANYYRYPTPEGEEALGVYEVYFNKHVKHSDVYHLAVGIPQMEIKWKGDSACFRFMGMRMYPTVCSKETAMALKGTHEFDKHCYVTDEEGMIKCNAVVTADHVVTHNSCNAG